MAPSRPPRSRTSRSAFAHFAFVRHAAATRSPAKRSAPAQAGVGGLADGPPKSTELAPGRVVHAGTNELINRRIGHFLHQRRRLRLGVAACSIRCADHRGSGARHDGRRGALSEAAAAAWPNGRPGNLPMVVDPADAGAVVVRGQMGLQPPANAGVAIGVFCSRRRCEAKPCRCAARRRPRKRLSISQRSWNLNMNNFAGPASASVPIGT